MVKESVIHELATYHTADFLVNAVNYAVNNGYWSEADYESLQIQLWQIMQKQTTRYTMGDSGSISVETAEELKKSIYFCIGLYCKSNGSITNDLQILKDTDLSEIFQNGQKEVLKLVNKGKRLLQKVRKTSIDTGNISYTDTLKAITGFFPQYDVYMLAHDIPCMIDYQLSNPPPDLCGIEYIIAYLQCLFLENMFCGKFPVHNIISLLQAGCFDYKQDLINIFEFVFNNAMGLALLDKNEQEILGLDIGEQDKLALQAFAGEYDKEKLKTHIHQSLMKLLHSLELDRPTYRQYYIDAAANLLDRIEGLKHIGFDNLFISFSNRMNPGAGYTREH